MAAWTEERPPEGPGPTTDPSVSSRRFVEQAQRMSSVSAPATRAGRQPEEQKVVRWRAETLVRAGYGAFAADVLSASKDVDLHLAVALPRNGCPHDLALKILL